MMDPNLRDMIDSFMSEVYEESKRNVKRKVELWNLIKTDKCKYCKRDGIIEYREGGVLFEWDCNEFLNINCIVRKTILKSIFGESFVNTNENELQEEIKKFYKTYDFQKDLIITGDLGTGKTSLMALLYLKAKKMKFEKVGFKTAFDFQNAIFENNLSMIPKLDIFLLDDLGTESSGKVFVSAFESIIDYRWRNRKTTIITTNLKFDDLTTLYPRAMDRLIQKGLIITLTGESKRRK